MNSQLFLLPNEFHRFFNGYPDLKITTLTADGSNREYARISYGDLTMIHCKTSDAEVNRRFVAFCSDFTMGLRIPKIFAISADGESILQEDLGDLTMAHAAHGMSDAGIMDLFRSAIDLLIDFHYSSVYKLADFGKYRPGFNIARDCTAHFRAFAEAGFAGQMPNSARQELAELEEIASGCPATGLVMGDFQPRNIMRLNNRLALIDFQDAFIGNQLYDLASILMSGSIAVSPKQRRLLLDYYFSKADYADNSKTGITIFYVMVILRRFRSMGIYRKLQTKKPEYYAKRLRECVQEFSSLTPEYSEYIPLPGLNDFLGTYAPSV